MEQDLRRARMEQALRRARMEQARKRARPCTCSPGGGEIAVADKAWHCEVRLDGPNKEKGIGNGNFKNIGQECDKLTSRKIKQQGVGIFEKGVGTIDQGGTFWRKGL